MSVAVQDLSPPIATRASLPCEHYCPTLKKPRSATRMNCTCGNPAGVTPVYSCLLRCLSRAPPRIWAPRLCHLFVVVWGVADPRRTGGRLPCVSQATACGNRPGCWGTRRASTSKRRTRTDGWAQSADRGDSCGCGVQNHYMQPGASTARPKQRLAVTLRVPAGTKQDTVACNC